MRWALAYLLLALVLTAPAALDPLDRAVGLPTPDAMDTAQLRWVFAWGGFGWGPNDGVFAPTGYPVRILAPNVVDHLLALPLVALLPWPLADNVWWWLALAANGVAGHLVGLRLGGNHGAGLLCGVAFATAEPVVREANLGHAPQALASFLPIAVLALARVLDEPRWTHGVTLGAAVAGAALVYWYNALFFAVAFLPVVVVWQAGRLPHGAQRLRHGAVLLLAVAVCLALVACPVYEALASWPLLAATDRAALPPVAKPAFAAIPLEHRFVATQGSGPLWWLGPAPAARSSQASLVLLGAAAAGLWRTRRWEWLLAAATGGVLLMGPYLLWGHRPLLVGGEPIPLPGRFLADLHPVLARLHWPQRWAIVVPLALLPLAAHCPRAAWLAPLVLLEAFLRSPNVPLGFVPTEPLDGWERVGTGPVLVLPPEDPGADQGRLGWIHRRIGAPLAGEMHLPPGAPPPTEWRRWAAVHLRDPIRPPGVAAIALDLSAPDADAWRARLDHLGEPEDIGPALVWRLPP